MLPEKAGTRKVTILNSDQTNDNNWGLRHNRLQMIGLRSDMV